MIWVTTWLTVSAGMANPMPTLPPPWVGLVIAVFTPISRPNRSSSGPPELPGLIGASVWITPGIGVRTGDSIVRSSAEMIPCVMVRLSPNGLPMANAFWPTSRSAEVPRSILRIFSRAGRSCGANWSTARS
jgi:hypothetical protein